MTNTAQDRQQVNQLPIYLTGEAAIWYHCEKLHLADWAGTKTALLKQFGLKVPTAVICQNLANITKTNTETFMEYLHQFEDSVDQIRTAPPLDELLDFFELGINSYKC